MNWKWPALCCSCGAVFSVSRRWPPKHRRCVPISDLTIQKEMVSFIYQNYAEKLTLGDIAAAGNSNQPQQMLCIIFKLYLTAVPYRFPESLPARGQLQPAENHRTQDHTVSVNGACGFNHLSYYSKIFMQNYGCTPNEFRKRNRAE